MGKVFKAKRSLYKHPDVCSMVAKFVGMAP